MREPGGGGQGGNFLFSFFIRIWMAYIPVAPDSLGATGCPRSRVLILFIKSRFFIINIVDLLSQQITIRLNSIQFSSFPSNYLDMIYMIMKCILLMKMSHHRLLLEVQALQLILKITNIH